MITPRREEEDTQNLRNDVTVFAPAQDSAPAASHHARASLIVLSGPEIGREIEIDRTPLVLGRSEDADTVIATQSVSRRHARIDLNKTADQRFYAVTDLGSSNGTFVNGEAAKGTHLRDGDRIRMGEALLKFVLQDEIEAQFHQDVHRLIHHDRLTGLLTMEAFRYRLDAAIRHHDADRPFSLAMTDLDGLKRVNDNHGHLAGRMVVREMGAMMRQALRAEDVAGLYGGDEAIILFPATALNDAAQVAEELRRIIEAHTFEHNNKQFSVTISQGLAEWPRHGADAESLIASADAALYAAKADGRNCIRTTEIL